MRAPRSWRAVPRLIAAWLLSLVAAFGAVGEDRIDLESLERQRAARAALHSVRPRISRYLEAAQKTVDQGKPAEGVALLDKLDAKRMNPYERALVYRLQAFLAYAAFDYAGAIQRFEKVLGEEILSVRDENRIRFAISQLHASLQQWRETIDALSLWFRYVEEPEPLAFYLLAVAHYQLRELDASLADARKAVDLSTAPAENWLQLLAALYVQKEEFRRALPVVQELAARFPSERHWVQLALVHAALEDYSSSLSVQQLAYRQGLLTEDEDLRRLARSYLHQNLPHPAAEVLAKGLADGAIATDAEVLELLANAWIAAREYERALAPLEQAAQLSEQGDLYVRLGQVYLQREAWTEAAQSLLRAIEKGGLSDPGNADLLLGIAYYNDARLELARSSFSRARHHASTRDAATRWLEFLGSETATQRTQSGERAS
jgi:tetratricopeptide (TPR) repeat protein